VNTDRIRRALQPLLTELNTQTLLDVGCGDFLWMKEINLDCQYIGIDVVEDVITANDRVYASETRIFQKLDATIDALPKADTVLCREMIFHLCFADIWRVLANIKRSQAVFLIATNDPSLRYNADIVSGDFRLLNLHRAPFYLPSPNLSIPDDRLSPGRTLSVWKTSELANL
jgi:2-polyprenyl-3-methyl-5-hydroxy-6-metoxy-1,4-benzoquinol methylase